MHSAPLILASASPRRQQLLSQAHPWVFCSPADIDELRRPEEAPRAFALRMAEEKGLAIERREGWVISGDTVVALGDEVLGKPESPSHAVEMLRSLSGQTHQVWSGWAIRGERAGLDEILASGVSCAQVTFRTLSAEEIEAYVATAEPMDKAGAYGIQGEGGRLVSSFEGSFDGVMGLPTLEVARALLALGALTPQRPELLLNSLSIRERVRAAAWRSGRPADEPQLLAVSKRHSSEAIREAMSYGLIELGESYLQELDEKREALSAVQLGPTPVRPSWHYIGAIQTNKAKRIGASAHWVHGVSRLSELQKLSQGAQQSAQAQALPLHATPLQVLIQVKLADELSKGGVSPAELPALLEASRELAGLKVVGLMTFPPLGEPEESRVYYRELRALRDRLASPELPLPHLSMGTSHDFEVAIEEGATWVRVGSALFGERPSP